MLSVQFFHSSHITPSDDPPLDPAKAEKLLLAGKAPDGMRVRGHLDFSRLGKAPRLPAGMSVTRLTLAECDPLPALPAGLRCYELDVSNSSIQSLPEDIQVEFRLDLSNCTRLERLPSRLKVGSLILRDCLSLRSLPENLDAYCLDIAGCTSLTDWPDQGSVRIGGVNARGCSQLRSLPRWLSNLSWLNVRDCVSLTELPAGLHITSWIDLAHTQIRSLPEASKGVQIRWRGVPISARIAFHPETITTEEILKEPNAELRRVLLERMGYATFLSQANAQIIDEDDDPGGERRLLRVAMQGDEDLVCLAVYCPSTGRQYMLRVPPSMRTCHQAAAWIAGFDNPDEYQPLAET